MEPTADVTPITPRPTRFIFDTFRKDLFDRLKFTDTKEDPLVDDQTKEADRMKDEKKRKKTNLSNVKSLAQKILRQTHFSAGGSSTAEKNTSCVFDEAAQCVFGALDGIPMKDMHGFRIEEACASLLTFVWVGEETLQIIGVQKKYSRKNGWSVLKVDTWEHIVQIHEDALTKVHSDDPALSTAHKRKRHNLFALVECPVQEDLGPHILSSSGTTTKTWEAEREELFTDSAWVYKLLQFMEDHVMTDTPPQFQQLFINITQDLMWTINREVA